MQYLIYFAVTTPLLLGWLLYEAATLPPAQPLFASGYERVSTAPAEQLAGAPVSSPASKKLAKNETAQPE